jgi:hypothetical protein
MSIIEIQEIGKIVAQVGGSAKDVFIWYMAKNLLTSILSFSLGGGTILGAYVLLKKLMNDSYATEEIARAFDGSDSLSRRDTKRVCEIIKEYKRQQ